MQKVNNKSLFFIALLIAIIPYCYLCFFTNPNADDFSLAAQAQQNDFFELIQYKYQSRNGRYISASLNCINPIVFNSYSGYKLSSLIIIIILFISVLAFIQQLFPFKNLLFKLTIALLVLLLFLHNMPIISEGIYWYTGSVVYMLGCAFFLLYLSCLIRFVGKTRTRVDKLVLILLLFISCGFNEVLTLLVVFCHIVIALVAFKHDFKVKKLVLLQLLFSVVFAGILILAPGNSVRGDVYNGSHQFLHSLLYSVAQVGRFLLLWVGSLPLVLASVLYYFLNRKLVEESSLFKYSFYLNRWLSSFLLLVIIFMCVFPAYWASGILGQHRTLNVAYFFFLIMWFVNLTVWFNSIEIVIKPSVKRSVSIAVFLIFTLLFSGNGFNVLHDVFSGNASFYNKEQQSRFKMLYEAKRLNNEHLYLEPLKYKPSCLYVSDISADPTDWKNHAYNMYFRLDSTKIHLDNK